MNGYDVNKEFRALADSYPRQASERVERNLLAEFRRIQRRRVWLRAGSVAACLAGMLGLALWQMKSASFRTQTPAATAASGAIVRPQVTQPAADTPAVPAVRAPVVRHKRLVRNTEVPSDNFAGFISLPSAIGGVPLGSPYIIRTKMSAAQLTFAGLPVMAGDQQQQVDTDVLVESDGMIRAIRLRQ
jgi:hypothetical protein